MLRFAAAIGRSSRLRSDHLTRLRRRMVHCLIRVILVAAFCLAAVSACQPATSTSQPTATPAPQPSEDALTVGAVVSLSGRYSREGALLRAGYEAWVRAANAAGGVRIGDSRRPVQLRVHDDRSEPLAALQVVEVLVRDEGVGLLLGPHSGAITLAAATAAERLGALTVAPDASTPQVYTRGLAMLVSVLPTDDTLFHGLLELANAVSPRARPIALVLPDEPPYVAAAEGARLRARELSLDEPRVELYPPAAHDVTMALERVALTRPRLLVVAAPPERVAVVAAQLHQLRLSPDMRAIVTSDGLEGLSNVARDVRDGALTLDWWTPSLRAQGPVLGSAAEFAAEFEREVGYRPTPRVAAAAAAGLALQLGVERAGTDDPIQVRAALAELDAVTFWGRLGWDAFGRNRVGRAAILQFSGATTRVVSPMQFAETNVLYPAR